MRKRASCAGAKCKFDEIDKEAIAKAIEQKNNVSRHDMVLYYHKRGKHDDLLTLANYNLMKRGMQLVKCPITVFNRAKPKRMKSAQAKQHIG